MRKIVAVLCVMITFASCKTQQGAVAEGAAGENKAAREIIDGHYKNLKDFKTINISASAEYKDSKQSQNVSAEIRIKKDETILVSVRVLGFTVAKALITPTRVSYYEKIGKKYFDGDYVLLSRWLGTELDFKKVQNMLLGMAMDDLNKGSYTATIDGGRYKLVAKPKGGTSKEFLFEGAKYLLKEQRIAQGGSEPRSVDIAYPGHKEHGKGTLPTEIKINAVQKDKVNIDIEYNTVTFDENLTFPYEVPGGYERVTIEDQ